LTFVINQNAIIKPHGLSLGTDIIRKYRKHHLQDDSRGNKDIPIVPVGVFDLSIDEIKINLPLNPSQSMVRRNPLIKVNLLLSKRLGRVDSNKRQYALGEAVSWKTIVVTIQFQLKKHGLKEGK